MADQSGERQVRCVIVIDDNPRLRAMVVDLLKHDDRVRLVGVAPDARSGLELVEREHPDIVIIDDQMPGRSGRETLPDLRAALPDGQIVLWSANPVDESEIRALGATVYVDKATPIDDVIDLVCYEEGKD